MGFRKDMVRFCLSDGIRFIFFILKQENGNFTYYQSTVKELGRPQDSNFDNRELIQLLLERVRGLVVHSPLYF